MLFIYLPICFSNYHFFYILYYYISRLGPLAMISSTWSSQSADLRPTANRVRFRGLESTVNYYDHIALDYITIKEKPTARPTCPTILTPTNGKDPFIYLTIDLSIYRSIPSPLSSSSPHSEHVFSAFILTYCFAVTKVR